MRWCYCAVIGDFFREGALSIAVAVHAATIAVVSCRGNPSDAARAVICRGPYRPTRASAMTRLGRCTASSIGVWADIRISIPFTWRLAACGAAKSRERSPPIQADQAPATSGKYRTAVNAIKQPQMRITKRPNTAFSTQFHPHIRHIYGAGATDSPEIPRPNARQNEF